jgi:2-keto-3-deoxy-L-rhamnonate aldolase RhmA
LGDFAHPAYAQAVAQIELAASSQGKLLGTAPPAGTSLAALLKRGYRLFIVGADAPLIREAMSTQVQNARSRLNE